MRQKTLNEVVQMSEILLERSALQHKQSSAYYHSGAGPLHCKANFGEPHPHLLLTAADISLNFCIPCMQDDYTGYKTYAQIFFPLSWWFFKLKMPGTESFQTFKANLSNFLLQEVKRTLMSF